MQLQVKHQTTYRYDAPVSYTIQSLRLSPRPHHGLSVLSWRVQADGRRELPSFTDGFGNIVHSHSINRTHDCITLLVEGEVETTDTAGILRGGAEPLPPAFYLRSTPLTVADGAIEALAAENGHGKSTIERLHRLMIAVRERVDYRLGATDVATTAAEALARGVGVCQDHSHIFIAAGPLRRRLSLDRRRDPGIQRQPRLGGGLCPGPRLGRLRRRQLHLPDRRLYSHQHRPRLFFGHARQGNPAWRIGRGSDGARQRHGGCWRSIAFSPHPP